MSNGLPSTYITSLLVVCQRLRNAIFKFENCHDLFVTGDENQDEKHDIERREAWLGIKLATSWKTFGTAVGALF